MEIVIYGLFFLSILAYLVIMEKLSKLYGSVFFIAILSLGLYQFNIYVGMISLTSLFLIIPFINPNTNDEESNNTKQDIYRVNNEELNYIKFKNFISDYINLIKKDYGISSLVIYEGYEDFFKLLKLDSIDNFTYVRNIIDNDDAIFTALSQFEKINLSTNDKLLKNNIIHSLDSEMKVFVYEYKRYLIFIFYDFENLNEEITKNINSFLYMFNDLKKQIVLKDYKRDLLALSEMFNKKITPQDILKSFIESLMKYPSFDTLIFTEYRENSHFIKLVSSDDKNILEFENTFIDNKNSIIELAFKSNYPLPGSYKFDSEKNILFGNQEIFNQYKSLLVYPVQEQNTPIGTLTLLSKTEGVYNKDIVNDLKLVFNMFDIAFFNANNFKKMEEMATTDGLTGLVNHRTFQEKLSDYLSRAKRYDSKIAVILSDIDHFKLVNDTYGHPMGDEVLRQVSKVLKKDIRDVDLVARYGGEEFVIVIENTSKEEAYVLANRIREEVKSLVFTSNQVEFNVTISMGFSIFPDSGDNKQKIIDFSDKALYYSKENGRDQVNCICDIS
jgi:diguanylate cyclase (GGDEF)-like protein